MEAPAINTVFAASTLEHIDALYGYAMTLTRDRTEAEDLVQETYLRAVRAANQPAGDGNLKAWLFVIMRNAWLNALRHKHNGRRIFEFEREEPQKADLVKLRFFAGMSLEQAAESLGMSPATAKRYWAYARAWLYGRINRK